MDSVQLVAPMSDKAWKNTERRHAKSHNAIKQMENAGSGKGSYRLGPQGHDLPDWVSICLAGESKHRDKLPQWLKDAVQQAEDNAARFEEDRIRRAYKWGDDLSSTYSKVEVVVLHESGQPFDDDLIVMRDKTFREFIMPLLELEYR